MEKELNACDLSVKELKRDHIETVKAANICLKSMYSDVVKPPESKMEQIKSGVFIENSLNQKPQGISLCTKLLAVLLVVIGLGCSFVIMKYKTDVN